MKSFARCCAAGLVALLMCIGAIAPSFAQETQSGLNSEITTDLASGQPGGITATTLRTVLTDMVTAIFQAQGSGGLVLSGSPSSGSVQIWQSPGQVAWSSAASVMALNTTMPLSAAGYGFFTVGGSSGGGVSMQVGGTETGRLLTISNLVELNSAGSIYFGVNGLASPTAAMELFASGGVYIGSSPSDPGAQNLWVGGGVTVQGPASGSASFFNVNNQDGTHNAELAMYAGGVVKWELGKNGSGNFFIYDDVGAQNVLSVINNGNMTLAPKGGTTAITGALTVSNLPTSAGGGGLYVCIDTSGVQYKKSTCP